MILVVVHLTSEPLADQSRQLVIFMTMTSLAGFWVEKSL